MLAVNHGLILLTRFWTWLEAHTPRIPLNGLQWASLAFVLISLVYIVATPPFEAQDELEHYTIAKALSLDSENIPLETLWDEQLYQPPLYYALASFITQPFSQETFSDYLVFNPYATPYDSSSLGNKNLLMTSFSAPFDDGVALTVRSLRLFNALTALITLWAVYHIAKMTFTQRPSVALVAVAITAFNPMFIASVGSVSNISLAIALNSLVVYGIVRLWRESFSPRLIALIAVTVGLGVITHLSILLVVPVVLLMGVYVARRDARLPQLGLLIGAMALGIVVFGGVWFAKNITQSGDVLGLSAMAEASGLRATSLGFLDILGQFSLFRASYWGLFGLSNVALPFGFYALFDIFVFMSLFGVFFMVLQLYAIRDFSHARRELIGAVTLLGVVLLGMVAYFVTLFTVNYADGRLLFPFIGAISPLLAAGFIEMVWWFLYFITPPDRSYVRATDAVPYEALHPNALWSVRWFALVAVFVPFMAVVPTYELPTPLDSLPTTAQAVYARYDNIELVGYEFGDLNRRYLPGELVPITLYWRAIAPTSSDYRLSIGLIPTSGTDVGKIDTLPNMGKYRTSQWEAGKIYPDTSYVRLINELSVPFAFRVQVTVWDDLQRQRVTIQNEGGEALKDVLLDGGVVVLPRLFIQFTGLVDLSTQEARSREFGVLLEESGQFGRYLRLEQFGFDKRLSQLLLVWDTVNEVDTDYAFFAHVLDAEGNIVGQKDVRPPMPTTFWRFGERLFTDHAIFYPESLPAGDYSLIVGVYNPKTMQRMTLSHLPIAVDDEETEPLPTDHIRLFGFSVDEQGHIISPELDALQPLEVTAEATDAPDSAPTPTLGTAPIAPTPDN